jgi:hypothetical protein
MKPCPNCPFTRACPPGKLGGSPAHVFIGQVHGPFWLPCHAHSGFNDPNWKTDYSKPQCVGAAIFRANAGVDHLMPNALLKCEPDRTIVFDGAREFFWHHTDMTERMLDISSAPSSIVALTRWQMTKPEVNHVTL